MSLQYNRRALLKGMIAVMGTTMAGPVLAATERYLNGDYDIDLAAIHSGDSAFSKPQFAIMQRLSDMIIPQTDTPGAIDAGVAAFIEQFITHYYKDSDKAHFFNGMRLLEHHCLISFKRTFLSCSPEQQEAALSSAEANQLGTVYDPSDTNGRSALTPESWSLWSDRPKSGRDFFKQIKSLTVLGYYTSELGTTRELIYDPVPGAYNGDVDFYAKGKHYTS